MIDFKKFKPSYWLLIVFVTLVVFSLFNLYARNPLLSDADDDALYLLLAKSIASGYGYREILSPGIPEHYKFPPLFSIILAPAVKLFGYDIMAIKTYLIIFNVLSLFAIYLFFNKLTGNSFKSWALMFLTGFSFEYFLWSNQIMSEIPFVMFSFFALYFLIRENGYTSILFTIGAILTKSVGVVLIPAITVYLLLKKKFKDASIYFILTSLIFGLWSWRNRAYAESYINLVKYANPYAKELGLLSLPTLMQRIGHNVFVHLQSMSHLIFQYDTVTNQFQYIIVLLILFALFVGFVSVILKRQYLLPLYLFFYMGFMAFWPWDTIRFISPLMPVFIYLFIEGVEFLLDIVYDNLGFQDKYRTYVKVGFIICLLFLTLPGFFSKLYETHDYKYDDGLRQYQAAAAWVEKNVQPSKVVMTRKPYLFALWSNRTTKLYPFTSDSAAWFREIVWSNYLVKDDLGTTTNQYLDKFMTEIPSLFMREFAIPGKQTAVYRIMAIDTTGKYAVENSTVAAT